MKRTSAKILFCLATIILLASHSGAVPDLSLGEFAPRDPQAAVWDYQDQINLYRFVNNDPINRIDPTGLQGESNPANIAALEEAQAAAAGYPNAAATRAAQQAAQRAAKRALAIEARNKARQEIEKRLESKAQEIISQECRGSVNREFPEQFKNSALKEILQKSKQGDSAAKKAWKLLTNSEYKK